MKRFLAFLSQNIRVVLFILPFLFAAPQPGGAKSSELWNHTQVSSGTDTDGDLVPDESDVDADNDGIPNILEGECYGADSLSWHGETWHKGCPINTYVTPSTRVTVGISADIDAPVGAIDNQITGGIPGALSTFRIKHDAANLSDSARIYLKFEDVLSELSFSILDVDADNSSQWQDRVSVIGYNNGTQVTPSLMGDTYNSIYSLVAVGNQEVSDNLTGANVRVSFESEVDSVVIVFANGPLAPVDPALHEIALHTLYFSVDCSPLDTDQDGIPDYLDLDGDNDGIPDLIEAGGIDTNGDGLVDNFTDANNNGLTDEYDPFGTGALIFLLDSDVDGVLNFVDLDSDNDGMMDILEAGGTDSNHDGRVDGAVGSNGFANALDPADAGSPLVTSHADNSQGFDANPWPDFAAGSGTGDTDGDGVPNYIDLDSDADGVVDFFEAQASGCFKKRTGTIDGNGVDLAWKEYQNCASNDAPFGAGTYGVVPYNHDGDAQPDYLDIDSDGDGMTDKDEAWDGPDADDLADNAYSGLGLVIDADFDGLADAFDAFTFGANAQSPIGFNIPPADGDGPSSMTANGVLPAVNFTPDFIFPTNTNEGAVATQPDYRDLVAPFAVEWMEVHVTLVEEGAQLEWATASEENSSHFKVLRSLDGTTFTAVGQLPANGTTQDISLYSFLDIEAEDLGATRIFYQLIEVDLAGVESRSNVVQLNLPESRGLNLLVYPNPASEQVNIRFTMKAKEEINVKIIDFHGKEIEKATYGGSAGTMSHRISVVDWQPGMYLVKVSSPNSQHYQKLIIR
ncbi:MAG: T9SS type A sorting domain-containing protein [Bacteroidota bacterium]